MDSRLRLARFHRVGGAVHAVALSDDGMHALVGSEDGLQLIDRCGNVRYRFQADDEAFSAVALAPGLQAGIAMARAGHLYRLDFSRRNGGQSEELRVAAAGIWDQRDDLYSLDFAPRAGEEGLIALGHHAAGLTVLDGRGRLLWQLGPRQDPSLHGRTWHAAISPDGRTIYAASLASGPKRDTITVIDAAIGKPARSLKVGSPVSLLVGLPEPLAVAAVHRAPRSSNGGGPSNRSCVTAFDATLQKVSWSLECPPDVMITAATAMPGGAALMLGTNTGELWRVGAFTGRILARYDLLYSSTVLSVAAASRGEVAAGLRNGYVAFLDRATDER